MVAHSRPRFPYPPASKISPFLKDKPPQQDSRILQRLVERPVGSVTDLSAFVRDEDDSFHWITDLAFDSKQNLSGKTIGHQVGKKTTRIEVPIDDLHDFFYLKSERLVHGWTLMRLASLDDEYREERLERVCIINHKVTSKSVWRLADAINDVNLPLISSEVESHIDRVCRFAVRGPLQIAMRKHTALSYAAVNGGEAASLHLINLGASVNVQDGKGHLPVHWACIHGLKRLFERCMKDRPDQINAHTPDGLSLLYLATTNERHELMRFLIRAGADVNEYFVNEKPESAGLLSCPVLSGRLSLASARILSESGADFSVQDLMGRTALHIAAINDKRDLYSFLMSIGCNDDLLDHRGRSPAACLKKNLH